jgi:hypothetical protein
MKVYVF